MVNALAAEVAWCSSALPGHCPGLPLALLGTLLSKVERPYKQRLGVAMAAVAGGALMGWREWWEGMGAVMCACLVAFHSFQLSTPQHSAAFACMPFDTRFAYLPGCLP